ncbi:TetR/AcrR family transcriptional regulator [Spirochaeta isovalerica]|uniref:AcrR family transcriptional regulator n=1 Tax=Spirochaeta isovalerica TaxID=150 RepID=A0A841RGF6_9SPIO|nr:TetR/AcrR family transcriptional regulator [Spirochaeta isovalerica]MBB6482471.1 AcrR family transcriptional regulator [Spirochaeta isovalerica]
MKKRMIYQVDETREKILAAAEKLFLEKGFFEAQIKDIAEKAGLSRNSVYRYYRDKSDLALTIIEKSLSRFEKTLLKRFEALAEDKSKSGLDKLKEAIRLTWIEGEQTLEGKLMAEFDAYYSGTRLTDDLKKKFILFDKPEYFQRLITLIERGKEDGSIRKDIDSHLAFVTILNGVRALNQRIILRGDVLVETTEGETDKMPDLLLDLLIDGLRNRSNCK